MDDTTGDTARTRSAPIGCRYPRRKIALLDAIKESRGDATRADTIRHILDERLEQEFPTTTKEAA